MTTEELFKKYSNLYQFEEGSPEYLVDKEDFTKCTIEFAKYHVTEALKIAKEIPSIDCNCDSSEYCVGSVDVGGILTCYPLDLIK